MIGVAIMAKKSLTDLLREEVKKSSELEGEKTTDNEPIEQDTKVVEQSVMNTPAKSNARRPVATKAQLEATISDLKAALKEAQHKEETFASLKEALDEAHRKEGSLQQQISDLQSELQQQQKTVDKLKKDLEKLDQLKAELEQTKKAALRLAEVNEKLAQKADTVKKENVDLKPQQHTTPAHLPERPIQKETDKPADFATKSWLL